MADPPKPTLDDLRGIAHADTLPLLERGDPDVRAALEAQWNASHGIPTPANPDTQSTPEPYTQTDADIEKAYREDPEMVRLRDDTARHLRIAAAVLGDALRPNLRSPKSAGEVMGDFARQAELERREKLVEREEKLQQQPRAYASVFKNLHDDPKQSSPPPKPPDDKDHWFDQGIWANPLFLGVLVMLAFAISFSSKASTLATWFCLVLAWLLATRLVHTRVQKFSRKWAVTLSSSVAIALVCAAFGWWLILPSKTSPLPKTDEPAAAKEENEAEGNVFLSDEHPPIGKTKTFTFFGDKNYGAVSFQARFGMSTNVTIIVLVHVTDPDPRYTSGTCLTAINNYQAIVDDLKAELRKGRSEFIDLDVYPAPICHYDNATDITPAASDALKRIASRKGLVLSIEGPHGSK